MVRILSVACAVLALSVAALAFQVHDTQARLDALESARTAGPTPPRVDTPRRSTADDDVAEATDTAAGTDSGARRDQVRAAARAMRAEGWNRGDDTGAAPADPAHRIGSDGQVSDLVRGELAKIDEEKQQAREEKQRARVIGELDALQKEAALSTEQRAQLQTMMESELVEMRQLFADARDSGEYSDLREKLRTVRAKTDENATALLDDDKKKAAYQKMREDERNRFLGRNRGD